MHDGQRRSVSNARLPRSGATHGQGQISCREGPCFVTQFISLVELSEGKVSDTGSPGTCCSHIPAIGHPASIDIG